MPTFWISASRFFSPFISTGIPSIVKYLLLSISLHLYRMERAVGNARPALDTLALVDNER